MFVCYFYSQSSFKMQKKVKEIDDRKKNSNIVKLLYRHRKTMSPESELNEFEPRLKSASKRFKLSAGLNPEKLITILSGTNHI